MSLGSCPADLGFLQYNPTHVIKHNMISGQNGHCCCGVHNVYVAEFNTFVWVCFFGIGCVLAYVCMNNWDIN